VRWAGSPGPPGAGTSDLQWVTDAYAVALAATVLSAGVLADLYGRRRITTAGLALTVAGSALICAVLLPGAGGRSASA